MRMGERRCAHGVCASLVPDVRVCQSTCRWHGKGAVAARGGSAASCDVMARGAWRKRAHFGAAASGFVGHRQVRVLFFSKTRIYI